MTSGILGIIACPMLEDELVYSMGTDPESKTIYVIDNDHSKSLKDKLIFHDIPFVSISEYDIMNDNLDICKD
jgi:hypothetical protein